MRIVRRYLFREVVGKIVVVMAVLLALSTFIELIGQLDDIGEGYFGLLQAIYYVLLKIPSKIFQTFPIAALLGSLLGLGALATHSEIIVLRASGISSLKLGTAVAATGTVLALISIAIGDFVAPSMEGYARQFRSLARSGQARLAVGGATWVRDGNTYINLGAQDENLLYGGVTMFRIEDGALVAVARVGSVDVTDEEQWVLNNFAETRFLDDGIEIYKVPQLLEPKNLDSELLALMEVRPSTLTGQRLRRYIDYLRENDLDSQRYEVTYWSRIMSSLAIIPMVVLGLPFSFGSLRNSGTGGRMVVGVAIGLAYFLGSQTLVDGGAVYGLAPILVAALPTIALALVATLMLARAR